MKIFGGTLPSFVFYKVWRNICDVPILLNGKPLSYHISYHHVRNQSMHLVLRRFVGVALSQALTSYNVFVFSEPTNTGLSYAMTLVVPNFLVRFCCCAASDGTDEER